MAIKTWQTMKTQYCNVAGCEVSLEAEAVYATEWLPDQPPHLEKHRCSHGKECLIFEKQRCVWSGNTDYDPFEEEKELEQ